MLENFDEKTKELYYQAMLEQGYSQLAAELVTNPGDMRICENHNAFGLIDGHCGDTMMVWIQVENGRIVDASYHTDGCLDSIAAGGLVISLVKGKTLQEALEIDRQSVFDALGRVSGEGGQCAILALKQAINSYLSNEEGSTCEEKC